MHQEFSARQVLSYFLDWVLIGYVSMALHKEDILN